MKNVLTITTDFGDQFAAIQLRAVIAALGFDGHVLENHSVFPFAVSEGAFEIKQVAKFSPQGSVHVGVIDPGVGTERWGVIIETNRSWFVGPNNGILYPGADEEGIKSVWRLHEQSFGSNISNTFHGRDVFVKAAVFLAQGIHPRDLNCSNVGESTLDRITFAEGEILHIDAYGNCKIHWPHTLMAGTKLHMSTKDIQLTIPVVKTFDDVPPHHPLALLGSHETLEIAINLANAKEFFRFRLGDRVTIRQL